jgi:hypothetical protein
VGEKQDGGIGRRGEGRSDSADAWRQGVPVSAQPSQAQPLP